MAPMEWTLIVRRGIDLIEGLHNRDLEIVIIRIKGHVNRDGSALGTKEAFTYNVQKNKALHELWRADVNRWEKDRSIFKRQPRIGDYSTGSPIRGWPTFTRFEPNIEEPE